MKLRWKILIAVGTVLLLMAASLTVTLHVQPQNELEACKKSLRDKGEKLEFNEILPPPLPLDSNSAPVVEAAFGMIGSSVEYLPHMMQRVAPGKAMIGWQQPDAQYEGLFTNSWEAFAAGVESNLPAIELLREVLERPKLDFQPDYKGDATNFFAHLNLPTMKISSEVIDAAIMLDLHNGDTGEATTNVLTLLALVHKNECEGPLISYLVRLAMTSLAIPPTWELLQATNLTDNQLAAVQESWQQMNFLGDAEKTFVIERAYSMAEVEASRASHEGFKKSYGGIYATFGGSYSSGAGWSDMLQDWTHDLRFAAAEVMWRSSWSYSDEIYEMKDDQLCLDALRAMQTNQSQYYKADYDAMSAHITLSGTNNASKAFFAALEIPDFYELFGDLGSSSTVRKTIQYETARRVVITAIALKRFQLKHGKPPQTLSELTPEFVSTVPIDPLDGKPLKYHPNPDGTFLLYSVGQDGKDDGGDPTGPVGGSTILSWQNYKARDWVWPQPATPAEVENFYEHPPK